MTSDWKDQKIRANDVQVGDYIWRSCTYMQVYKVQYGSPHEGFVWLEIGPINAKEGAEMSQHIMLGDDAVTLARKSGDAPEYLWHEIPVEVVEALPFLLKSALENKAASAVAERLGAISGDGRRLRAELAKVVTAGLWIAAISGKSEFAEALGRLRT